MATATIAMNVKAPADKVWAYLNATQNIADWWGNCTEVHQKADANSCCLEWRERISGVTLHADVVETMEQPGEQIRLHMCGDICGDILWQVRPQNGGTQVVLLSDYDLPVHRLAPYLSPYRLLTFQQTEAEAMAARIRARFVA